MAIETTLTELRNTDYYCIIVKHHSYARALVLYSTKPYSARILRKRYCHEILALVHMAIRHS